MEATHIGHRERLRRRAYEEGLLNFQPHEILELLMYPYIPRKDTNEIAHRLIDTFGGLSAVLDADATELAKIEGMTLVAANNLAMLPQVFARYNLDKIKEKPVLDTTKKCADYFASFMRVFAREEVFMACLDNKCNLIKRVHLQTGVVNQSNIYLRDIIQYATMYNASGIVLAHNHPSGSASPSSADEQITRSIAIVMNSVGIPLHDHLIISAKEVYSFKRDGNLDEFNKSCMVSIVDGKIKDVRF